MLQRLEAPTYTHLIGAAPALATLTTVLLLPDAPWLVAMTGMGGIGKTTLADVLLRHLNRRPPLAGHWLGGPPAPLFLMPVAALRCSLIHC